MATSALPNEGAQYGMVTACYFAIFMYRYNKGHISTDSRAMINIAIVFMLVQPLCRIAGGMNGLVAFVALLMSSLIMLPSPQQDRENAARQEKKKVEEKNMKTKTKSSSKKVRRK